MCHTVASHTLTITPDGVMRRGQDLGNGSNARPDKLSAGTLPWTTPSDAVLTSTKVHLGWGLGNYITHINLVHDASCASSQPSPHPTERNFDQTLHSALVQCRVHQVYVHQARKTLLISASVPVSR